MRLAGVNLQSLEYRLRPILRRTAIAIQLPFARASSDLNGKYKRMG